MLFILHVFYPQAVMVIPINLEMIFTTSLLNQAYQAYRFERDSPVFSHFSVHPVVFNVVPFFLQKISKYRNETEARYFCYKLRFFSSLL